MKLAVLLISGALLIGSCGDDDDDDEVTTSNATCVLTPSGYSMCHLFENYATTSLSDVKTSCESADDLGGAGTYTESETAACETSRLGTCTWTGGSGSIKTAYLQSDSTPDVASATSHCSSAWEGTWETYSP